jgi:hypothetical protein
MRTTARFESCYVALLASLWAEMEAILGEHMAAEAARADSCERMGLRLEALLLEITLLGDKCDFLRWRGLLTPEQADVLHGVVHDLHDLLDVEPFGNEWPRAGVAIVRAQNRVFDELQRVARFSAGPLPRQVA